MNSVKKILWQQIQGLSKDFFKDTEWKHLFVFAGQDTRIRFSLEPSGGDPGYNQWKDAMKMVARLPEGVPTDFRKKVHTILLIFNK